MCTCMCMRMYNTHTHMHMHMHGHGHMRMRMPMAHQVSTLRKELTQRQRKAVNDLLQHAQASLDTNSGTGA